jgi:HEAT repeat protein
VKSIRLFSGIVCLAVSLAVTEAPPAEEVNDELIQLVVNLLGDQDKDVRALGLEQVRTEAKGPAATERFAALLPSLSPDSQAGLLSALADRGDDAARPAVLDMLASPNEQVRVAAIGALGSLGKAPDVHLLVQLLTKPSKAEQAAARGSLVRLQGEQIPALIVAEMKEAPVATRVELIEILSDRHALGTMPDLLSAAVDADAAVRAAAMAALGQLAGPENISGMVRGVLAARTAAEREAAEKSVARVCSRIEDAQERADPLLAAMDKLSAADRQALLPTLGRIGGPVALESIEAAIAEAASHELGIRALCNWPDASIAARLIELVNTDKHAPHRTMALRALIRVAPLPDDRSDHERLTLLQKAMTMCQQDAERNLVLQRARAIRIPESLRFVEPYLDQLAYAQQACRTVVELAHHRQLREANKAEFGRALDKVIRISKDATVIERAQRYKRGQTWARPITPES